MASWNPFSKFTSSQEESNEELLVQNANSEGFIKDYISGASNSRQNPYLLHGRSPKFDPDTALKLVKQDPVVRAAIITIVDKVIEAGWRIKPVDGNAKSNKKLLERKLREMRFDRLLRKVVYHLVMYNNAFIEIVKKGDNVTDLNLLETSFMRIVSDDHGDVQYYYQEVAAGVSPNRPEWQPDEVVHLKLDDFTTNLWSEFNIEAVYETVLIKDSARQWLQWALETNQFRSVLSIENASGPKVKEFMGILKAVERLVTKHIPVEGKMTSQRLQDPDIVQHLLNIIEWCNTEIRQLLQTPPVAVGMSDASGRSDGAEHRMYLNTRIFNIHRLLEDDITYDLFPKMGFDRVEFVFGILDETVRTRVFETAQLMRNTQFTAEAIQEYLESQGVVFDTDKPLLSMEDIQSMSNKDLGTGNEGAKGNKSADAAQSRQRQNDQDLSKGNQKGQQK